MGRPHSDLVLPTTKHKRVLDLPTLSYKNICNTLQVRGVFQALLWAERN